MDVLSLSLTPVRAAPGDVKDGITACKLHVGIVGTGRSRIITGDPKRLAAQEVLVA